MHDIERVKYWERSGKTLQEMMAKYLATSIPSIGKKKINRYKDLKKESKGIN